MTSLLSAQNPAASTPDDTAEGGTDLLLLVLTLTIEGTDYKIPGGQIKSIALALREYDFTGQLTFVLADDKSISGAYTDKLHQAFVGDALISVVLNAETPMLDEKVMSGAAPLELHGLVSERSYQEISVGKSPKSARMRVYQLCFLDPAQLLWKQHYPCALYTGKTWRQVIEANRGDLVELSYDWDLLNAAPPHVFLGHEPVAGTASFYDFVLWLTETRGGFFTYDYEKRKYRLSGKKPQAGAATRLHPGDIASFHVELPVLPRHGVRIHNTYTEQAKTTPLTPAATKRAVAGVQKDYLLCTPIGAQVNARVALERERLDAAPGPVLHVEMKRWPSSPLCPLAACQLGYQDGFLVGGSVLPAPFAGEKTQVCTIAMTAHAVGQGLDDGYGADRAAHRMRATVCFSLKSTKRPPRLTYTPPTYPRLLEGKVVSEEGEEKEETYQIYEDPDTSVESYKVRIPLFADQKILVDFKPLLASGHFYFPAYKRARVLVAVDLDRAWLVRYLDWRPEGRLPKETQGNHLLVGKTPQSGTSLRHVYEEEKPVLRLKRTHDKDIQLIEIGEGHLRIQVEEEEHPKGSLVCSICLDKNKGGAVVIESGDAKLTQSIAMDGTQVSIRVKGEQDESTITQTADSVVIKSKHFLVDAETISCKSKGATSLKSEDTLTVSSSKDLQLESSAKLSVQASSDLTGKAANVKLVAEQGAALTGQGAGFKAESGTATMDGVTVKLTSSGQVKATAAAIELQASGMFKAEAAGVLTVKGGITNIQGSLVKLG